MNRQAPPGQNRSDDEREEQVIMKRIYSAIMEQRLAPKTKLSEAKLCESFGVGRMRVRRALLLLASQGIVDLHSNRGAYVACPSPKEAHEVFEARMIIEPNIVRRLSDGVKKSTIRQLRDHIAKEDAARKRIERAAIIRLSGEFHVELAIAHGNSALTKVIRELVTRTSLIVGMFGSGQHSACPEDEHGQILDAMEARDAEGAAALVLQHLSHIQSALDLSKERTGENDLAMILGGN